jgi:2-methylcitrate dehydratase PrpD
VLRSRTLYLSDPIDDLLTTGVQLQKKEPRLKDFDSITKIVVELAEAAYHHGCFPLPPSPIPSIAAQMIVGFGVASQLVDHEVFVKQFTPANIERPEIRKLVEKCEYVHQTSFDAPEKWFTSRLTFHFDDGSEARQDLDFAKCIKPGLTDEQIRFAFLFPVPDDQ